MLPGVKTACGVVLAQRISPGRAIWPAGHAAQPCAVEPTGSSTGIELAGHAWQAADEVLPGPAVVKPAGQPVHAVGDVAPAGWEYLPEAHGRHAEAPTAALYVPGAHREQAVVPQANTSAAEAGARRRARTARRAPTRPAREGQVAPHAPRARSRR